MFSHVFWSCFLFCVLILCPVVLSQAENGAVHWKRPHWTENGECIQYQFWQQTPNDAIYIWKAPWLNWAKLQEFNPTPGRFAFVTDKQWIDQALNKKQASQGRFGG